jgi:condensin complex subunit 2
MLCNICGNVDVCLVWQDEGNQTNFQRASLTLAAGVVIYSQRVDSIHNDAFKVLTGLSRSAARGVHEDEGNPSKANNKKGCILVRANI